TARLATWLHRIVTNVCLMRLRSRKRRRTVALDDQPAALECAGDRPEEALSREEMRDQVRQCIHQLPDSYREVILLRDIEELDTAQAAGVLGTTAGVVKTRLHRARQALRGLLEPLLQA